MEAARWALRAALLNLPLLGVGRFLIPGELRIAAGSQFSFLFLLVWFPVATRVENPWVANQGILKLKESTS
jgi:hypothetical protein